jgi:hypothetical protein
VEFLFDAHCSRHDASHFATVIDTGLHQYLTAVVAGKR